MILYIIKYRVYKMCFINMNLISICNSYQFILFYYELKNYIEPRTQKTIITIMIVNMTLNKDTNEIHIKNNLIKLFKIFMDHHPRSSQ